MTRAARIHWTTEALDDLRAIRDFIGHDSPHYAALVVEELLASVERLERFPLSGRRVPERPREDLRELVKPPYRIVYRRIGNGVHIITIFCSSRLFPTP
jgi:addiction module RelE/StbE family toxin